MTELPNSITFQVSYRTIEADGQAKAAEAKEAQQSYLDRTQYLIWSTVGSAICGGLLLYSADLDPQPSPPHLLHVLDDSPFREILVVLQAVCLGVAAFNAYRLGREAPKARWVRARLRREHLRLELERVALELSHAESPETFKRAGNRFVGFVEAQRRHLSNRKRVAQSRLSLSVVAGGVIAGLVAAASALAGLQNTALIAGLGIIGVLAPAVSTALRDWSDATVEEHRETLHEQSAQELGDLLVRSAEFEQAIDAHDLPRAKEFMNEAFEILKRDHAGFAALLDRKEDPQP